MIVILTVVMYFTDQVSIHVCMPIYALSIINIGARRSVYEMIVEYKKIHVDKRAGKGTDEGVETMSQSEVLQFPIYAGATLCGMYFAIEYFGKDAVNNFILCYFALVGSQSVKGLLLSLKLPKFEELDGKRLFHLKFDFLGLDQEVTLMDVVGLLGSGIAMYFYVVTKNWIFNNIIATMVSISGIQLLFLGNFKNGFLMLTGLFFYDIFFVFKTDVMLTVAKSIDAPIKLLFPVDWSQEPPKFSLLGLGDIVIPGIFMAMCLRYDVIKSLNISRADALADRGEQDEVLKMLHRANANAPKTYFIGNVVGYLLAIITTVVIMLVFDHGQPALLYLVPACLGATSLIALAKGEFKKLWEYSEENIVDDPEEEEDDKKKQ